MEINWLKSVWLQHSKIPASCKTAASHCFIPDHPGSCNPFVALLHLWSLASFMASSADISSVWITRVFSHNIRKLRTFCLKKPASATSQASQHHDKSTHHGKDRAASFVPLPINASYKVCECSFERGLKWSLLPNECPYLCIPTSSRSPFGAALMWSTT